MPSLFDQAFFVPAIRIRKFLLPALLVLLLGGLGFALMQRQAAPEVVFSTIAGKTLPLESLRGRVVLVNFWATSCTGCVAEMPKLIDTYRQYHARGFDVVAVAMRYDPPQQVVRFARERGLPFDVALDADGSLAQSFGDVQLTPTSFVIDRRGEIVQRVTGEIDFAALAVLLEQKLNSKS